MNHFDDDETSAAPLTGVPLDGESELARRAGAGDKEAFDLLYDRYFARTSWYFTIFARRKAKAAVTEVLAELFGSVGEPSNLSFAERAYRLARAAELRHAPGAPKAGAARVPPAKVAIAKSKAAGAPPSRA